VAANKLDELLPIDHASATINVESTLRVATVTTSA
jgi:hypothetical protein